MTVCLLFGATAANAKTKKQAVDIYDLSIDDNIAMPQLEKQADEIKKFQPSIEVDEAEDAIYNIDTTDVTAVIDRIVKEITEK